MRANIDTAVIAALPLGNYKKVTSRSGKGFFTLSESGVTYTNRRGETREFSAEQATMLWNDGYNTRFVLVSQEIELAEGATLAPSLGEMHGPSDLTPADKGRMTKAKKALGMAA